MKFSGFTLDRRSFLMAGAPFALSLPAIGHSQTLIERGQFDDEQLPLAREQLLNMVNSERANAGLSQLQLDDLASKVATEHARDMVRGGFLSHWGSDGRTPFHRYCFAGGTDAVQENVSSAESIGSVSPLRVLGDLQYMHESMLRETPPNDGHRKTILFPFHTHVGFGIALRNRSLRLDELYLARYIQLEPFAARARPKSTITLAGKLINPAHFLNNIDVSFEPFPKPPGLDWLREPRPITLPNPYLYQRPKVPDGTTYTDGGTGDFEWGNGKFRVRIRLSKDEPGIYTVVFWLRRVRADKGFPVAQVCILSQP